MRTGDFNLNLFNYTAEIHPNSASKVPAKLFVDSSYIIPFGDIIALIGFLKIWPICLCVSFICVYVCEACA